MKKYCLAVLIVAILSCLFLAGCDFSDDVSTIKVVEISGVTELKFKLGEATDENILKDVKVVLSDGTKAIPTLDKRGKSFDKAGKYEISYVYNEKTVNSIIWVYDNPQVYYNGEVLTADDITLSYLQASQSFDFVKGVEIKDSFGVLLEVKTAGDKFENEAKEYKVTYTAEDAAGNVCTKQIKYTVVGGDEPSISNATYVISMDECVIPWDLKENKKVDIYCDGEIVNPVNYEIAAENLKFKTEYILTIGAGKKIVNVYTENGKASFELTVVDEGNPVFVFEPEEKYIFGGAEMPVAEKIIDSHDEYQFSYIVRDNKSKEYIAKNNGETICFVDDNGNAIPVGDYTVSVTCEYNGKTAVLSRNFKVAYCEIQGGESLSLTKKTFEAPIGGVSEAYAFVKNEGVPAWDGRLYYACPVGAYSLISFDIYFKGCSAASDGKVNAMLSACVDNDYNRIVSVIDKENGNVISEADMMLEKWYTVNVFAYSETNGSVYIYFNPYTQDNIYCEGYVSGSEFVLTKGVTPIAFVRHPSCPQGQLAQTVENGEIVVTYTGVSSVWDARVQFSGKILERVNAEQAIGNKSLSMDFRFTDDVSTIQLWYYTPNCAAVTVEELVNAGVAMIAADGYSVGWSSLIKDKWYKLFVDIDKFTAAYGSLVETGGNNGLQAATLSTLEYKCVDFISNTDIPDLEERIDPFEAFQPGSSVTINEENIATYIGSASDWDSRAQFTRGMFNKCVEYYALTEDYSVSIEFRFTGDVKGVQFWVYTLSGTQAPTLESLVNEGKVVIAKNGYSIGFERLIKGEWYKVYVDIHKFGEIKINNTNIGVQVASQTSIEYKLPEFIKNSDIPDLKTDAFEKFQNCTVETDAETGITTYTGLSDDWGSRAQFTRLMFNKCMEYYALTEDYSVAIEFRFTGDVKNIQFWVYSESGTAAPTLDSLIGNGTAIVVADGYKFSFGALVKDKWYKVYIDVHKFGAIKISDPNIGVQVASQTSIQYKVPEFVKNSDIPVAKEPLIPFEKVSAGVALSTEYKEGAFITSYTGTSSDWDSRIQLTDNAFAKYTENYNTGNAFMTFDIKYVGAVADFQFWKMNASGGYGETPTLSGLISSGVVIVYKNGESCTYDEIVVGEWYTLQFDMSLFGALGTNESNHGFHFGAQTSIEFKNFEFVTK